MSKVEKSWGRTHLHHPVDQRCLTTLIYADELMRCGLCEMAIAEGRCPIENDARFLGDQVTVDDTICGCCGDGVVQI